MRAALDESFARASGRYFDNDTGRFSEPNASALSDRHAGQVMHTMHELLAGVLSGAGRRRVGEAVDSVERKNMDVVYAVV